MVDWERAILSTYSAQSEKLVPGCAQAETLKPNEDVRRMRIPLTAGEHRTSAADTRRG